MLFFFATSLKNTQFAPCPCPHALSAADAWDNHRANACVEFLHVRRWASNRTGIRRNSSKRELQPCLFKRYLSRLDRISYIYWTDIRCDPERKRLGWSREKSKLLDLCSVVVGRVDVVGCNERVVLHVYTILGGSRLRMHHVSIQASHHVDFLLTHCRPCL